MKKLKLGIAGINSKIEKFSKMINDSDVAEVSVIWDSNIDVLEHYSQLLNVNYESDFDKFVSDYSLDGVLILTANYLKRELICKAASCKINIFVEKPLAVKKEDAFKIRQAIINNNVTFFMSDPFVRKGLIKIKQLVNINELGTVTGGLFRVTHSKGTVPARDKKYYNFDVYQGGMMADMGTHGIHMAYYLFGKPDKLSAILTYNSDLAKSSRCDENALINFLYADDKVVTLQCDLCSVNKSRYIEVYGTQANAYVLIDNNNEEVVTVEYRNGNRKEFRNDELPPSPKQHIEYFLEMLVNKYPNDIIGIDDASNSGVSINDAVVFTQIVDTIYTHQNEGLVTIDYSDK